MILSPATITVGDICTQALRESGALGIGQVASAEDINDAWFRLQAMLQEWERKRYMVYHLVTLAKTSTGAVSYTVGPGGDIDTGVGSVRPAKLEAAFLRQLQNASPNQIDFPLGLLQAREDYNRIALKSMASFPQVVYYDAGWPLGVVYPWPVAQSAIYAIHLTVLAQLPSSFASVATVVALPFEYFSAIYLNLALRLRPKYQIPTMAGDQLPGLAKNSLNVVRGANGQVAALVTPSGLSRQGSYNIFSDRNY